MSRVKKIAYFFIQELIKNVSPWHPFGPMFQWPGWQVSHLSPSTPGMQVHTPVNRLHCWVCEPAPHSHCSHPWPDLKSHVLGCVERMWNVWGKEWVGGWVKEWVKEWVSKWVKEWMNECINECMNECLQKWVIALVSEWVSEWVIEWVSEWMRK